MSAAQTRTLRALGYAFLSVDTRFEYNASKLDRYRYLRIGTLGSDYRLVHEYRPCTIDHVHDFAVYPELND